MTAVRIDLPLLCALCVSLGAATARAQVGGTVEVGASAEATPAEAKAEAATAEPAVAEAPAAAEPEAPSEALPWTLVHRRYNTRDGSSGGLFLGDASSGAQGSLRIQLFLDAFSGGDFLYEGDEIEQSGQTLSVGWTALEFLELFGSVRNRDTSSATPTTENVHSLGDVGLGFKAFGALDPVWHVGGGAAVLVVNDIGGRETLFDATHITLTGDLTLDLRGRADPLPIVGRFELAYTFDNGSKVVDGIEDARYADLSDARPRVDEVRHLVSRFERYGLGVNRVDRLAFGLGLEVPFAAATDFHLHPLLEWRFGIPVNRQGYDCAFFSSDEDAGSRDGADDSCIGEEGIAAWPMNLAVGLRVVPPVRGVSLAIGADFGLSGTSTFVRELAPTSPFAVLVALSYDYDARPEPPPPPPPEPPAPTGNVRGLVVSTGTGAPVAGAIVRFVGRELDPHLTDEAGRFASPSLEPGEVLVALTHDAHAPGQCIASVPPEGGEVELRCELAPLAPTGTIEGRAVDLFDTPIAGARVVLAGAASSEVRTDVEGKFRFGDLVPGGYTVQVESDAHLARGVRVSVAEREQRGVQVALLPRSDEPSVEVRGDDIRVGGLAFDGDGVELGTTAVVALAELADLLLRDPGIRRVRIQGDGGSTHAFARAVALKERLVAAGIDESRLDASSAPAKRVAITALRD